MEVSLNGELGYDPSDIQVEDNTLVTFIFPQYVLCSQMLDGADRQIDRNTQHSVTQSTLEDPCTPLSGGFDSGLTSGGTTFSIFVPNASVRE